MPPVIGIDLGTTFSAAATLDDTGRPKILHNDEGQNITPSVVTMEGDSTVLVGEIARRAWNTDPSQAAARFKRAMGSTDTIRLGSRSFTPTELSSLVLKKLAKDARATLGDLGQAVVTIPANFASEAREATLSAARTAGLDVQHIINEPTAAALYYAYSNGTELHGTFVVYDLGGGTFDISVIRVDGTDIEVIASNGVSRLGGDDFDEALLNVVSEQFQSLEGRPLTHREYNKSLAEEDKKSLSRRKQVLVAAGPHTITVTRDAFEASIASRIAQAEMLCETTLDEAGVTAAQIESVFLAGGSTRIPAVQASVRKVFQQDPQATANVDEVVALGAALYAAYRSDRSTLSPVQRRTVERIKISESTSQNYGTLCLSNHEGTGSQRVVNDILIEKGTKIPCSVTKTYYTAHDGQRAVDCQLTECASSESDPRFVNTVWDGTLELPEGRPKGQEIQVTYRYDDNQTVQCSFVDTASGQRTDVSVTPSSNGGDGDTDISRFEVE